MMKRTMWAMSMITVMMLTSAAWGQDAKPANPMTDTSVYPIAVWAMGGNTAKAFADMGVNIYVGESGDAEAWCSQIAKHGGVGFVHWAKYAKDEAKRKALLANPGFAGWMHGDEPDNAATVDGEYRATGIPPAELIARYNEMKKSSTPAAMYLNLGQGLANGMGQSTPDATYREFMNCADIVCYDVYPTSTQANGQDRLHLVARGMSRLKAFASLNRPAWIWLECTAIHGNAPGIGFRPPTPHELRAEIWMSILHGADGIGYFPHQFNPYKGGPAAIPADLQKEMKLTNGLLHKLAPVLRTGKKTLLKVDAAGGRVDAAMWTLGEQTLIVVVNMKNADAKATIGLPDDAAKSFMTVGQNTRLSAKKLAATTAYKPYEVRLFWTGKQLTNQSYRYPEPVSAEATMPENRTFDFEGGLPKGTKLTGNARVTQDKAHSGKASLYLGEMGTVTIPVTDKDFKGKVTLWVYDSSKKHSREDENKPAVGPCWGLEDSSGRMMLYGIIRRSFLSQNSYSFVFTSGLRGYPSPGYAATDRTKPGWYKWEFDLTKPGKLTVRVNGKAIKDISEKHYGSFDKGFTAIKLVGGGKGEFEDIYIDDIQVDYAKPKKAKPGKIADLPLARDLRKGVYLSRTQHSIIAAMPLAEAPTIDGSLKDLASWVNADTLGTWSNTSGTGMATYQTVGVVGRHGDKLYMAFRCAEPFLDELVTNKKAGWQNDCIEIWFDPDNRRTSFAHITVTANGRVEATRTVQDSWGEGKRDEAWKPNIVAKTGRVKNGWTVELAIDIADVGDIKAHPVWGFDVARERKPAPGENSVWTHGGFNAAREFGQLTFRATEGVTLSDGRLRNRSNKPTQVMVHVLVSAPEAGQVFPTWESRWRNLASEIVVYELPPASSPSAGSRKVLDADLMRKLPDGGRVRFTLLDEKLQGKLWEEFIVHAHGGIKKK
jgi:cellulose/xylan binding protein with CBM9 domain